MKKKWTSSQHPISDIRDWQRNGRLEIQPDFQRREVWSEAAKIMLMDTILRAIPMPKAFVSLAIREQQSYRIVIDGQQRISSILEFLDDKFALEGPFTGEHKGLTFSNLPDEAKDEFLQYQIDFNDGTGFSDAELRETYSRLNKYSFALTRQELRRADYPGAFLDLAESLAVNDFFENAKIFTVANRRRLADVEFISELLAGLLAGPQEKRETLDSFYLRYSSWDDTEKGKLQSRIFAALDDLSIIFPADRPISSMRYKQKSDFYSLLLAIDDLRGGGGTLEGVDVEHLRKDLRMLDFLIEPESQAPDCRDYAIKCVSQANTHGSRRWRTEFLKAFLAGTYFRRLPTGDAATLFYRIATGNHGPFGAPTVSKCGECDKETTREEEQVVAWRKESEVFQLDNACRLHRGCVDLHKWHILEGPVNEAPLTFARTAQQPALI